MTDAGEIDDLTERIIGCAIEVHRELGPGLLESIYHQCLAIELRTAGFKVEANRKVPLTYKGQKVNERLRLDILVDDRVVIEIKATDRHNPIYSAQVITYLKLTGCPAGLLLNFNMPTLRAGLKRLYHPDLYPRRRRPAPAVGTEE